MSSLQIIYSTSVCVPTSVFVCVSVCAHVHVCTCLNCVMCAVSVIYDLYSVLALRIVTCTFLYSSQCPHARPTVADIHPKQYGAEVR